MSENERMDRAKRIRQMREGSRDDESTADTNGTAGATADADGETAGSEADSPEETGSTGTETADPAAASTDGGATAVGTTEEAETADTSADITPDSTTSAPLPDAEEIESAVEEEPVDDESDADAGEEDEEAETAAPGPAGVAGETTHTETETRVLEFTLDDEQYCLDIEYIEEIVKQEQMTRVPNTPEFVEGVVDLRGQITTIVNPKVTLEKENTERGNLIVVFDDEAFEDQGYIGWVVDDVRQVSPVSDADVNDSPMEQRHINGIIDREDDEEFVIWTTPDLIFEDAA
jgi:purine-binding chemotaxis protein CheW